MSEQNIITATKVLKEIYLPFWKNQLGTEPSALLGQVVKRAIHGNRIVAGAPIGLSGGFGFSEEGQATPASGNVNFSRFETNAKDMYVDVSISEKAIVLGTPSGAMADLLETEIKAAYDAAKWHVGRALFGNGTGKLATVTSASGATVVVDSVQNLKEGIIVDIYASGATKASTPSTKGARIKAINRATKTVTFDVSVTAAENSFITTQYSFMNEITGLGAIFDDNITTLYGVTKANDPYIKPIVVDANHDIDDTIITQALRQSTRDKNGKVDLIMAGDNAYDAYVNYLRSNNYRVEEHSHELVGGFKAISFVFSNREVNVVNEQFVPENEMWGVDTKATELHQTDWEFASNKGEIFTLMEGKSVYRALLRNYGDLIVTNPGACIRITNCDPTT